MSSGPVRAPVARRHGLLAALSMMLFCSAAAAHTVWLEPDAEPGAYRVHFGGHQGKLLTYPPERLKSVDAYDARGNRIAVARIDAADGVRLKPAATPALIALHYDNGVWTRTPEGRSVNQPMDRVPGATSAVSTVKYHKTILQWSEMVARPLGQPFEITPLSAQAPRAGVPLRLRVSVDGKPVAGASVARGEGGETVKTDAEGIASFVPVRGFNKVWSAQRRKVPDEPRFSDVSYEYLLGFDAE